MRYETMELLARSVVRCINGDNYEHLVYKAQELESDRLYVTIREHLNYKGLMF